MHSVAFRGDPRRVALAAVALLSLVTPAAAPALPRERDEATAEYRAWVAEHEARFAAHPELARAKGSGFKPFHRQLWFMEQRLLDGELPGAEARSTAWRDRVVRTEAPADRVTETWYSLGPANFAGRMLSLAFDPFDPSVAYAGSASGGLWKSTDAGASWRPLTDDLPSLAVGGVAVSPLDRNVVVIATGEGTYNVDRVGGVGVLRSTDAGATWNATGLTASLAAGHGFHFLHANPLTGTMLAGASDGLYRSTDTGATWTQVKNGGHYYDAQWRPGDASTVYAVRGGCSCVGAGVKVSTDDGLTWAVAGGGSPSGGGVGKSKLAVTPANPALVYAIFTNQSSSDLLGVWRSTDGGGTWTQRATAPNIPGNQGWYSLALVADPDNAQGLIAGGVQLYRSTDGGATFASVGGNVHVDHHVAAYEPGGASAVWVGTDGGLWRSTNDGASWTGRNDGLITYQFYDVCVNRKAGSAWYVMGGTQDNGTDKWSGTSAWSDGLGGDGMVCTINEVNGTSVFAETQFGNHYRNISSGDGGWTSIQSGITGNGSWVAPVAEDPARGPHLYTATADGIFRTTSGGSQGWFPVATHRATWIDFSRVDGNVAWTTHGTGTWVTTDDGNSWTKAAAFGFGTGTPTKVHAHPGNASAALVTFSGYSASIAHVALTTDLGATWTDVSGDLPALPVNAIAVDPDAPARWYVGTDLGVYRSVDGGATWRQVGGGSLPNAVVSDLEISGPHRKLVAGTHGRGAWELDLPLPSPEPGGGATDAPRPVPSARLLLDPPWPNPAADRVTLRFASREPGPVELVVVDVRGRLVTRVASLPDGDGIIRTAPWYPEDRAAGVYFAVLRAGATRTVRKIVVRR